MRNLLKSNANTSASFLPADYVQRKHERRANFLCLALFVIVIIGVLGTFFVTNQRRDEVRDQQKAINVRYAEAAKDIEKLKDLEKQKGEAESKAELAAALIEKAPRSVVLAEIINRLPENAALLQMELDSKRIKSSAPVPRPAAQQRAQPRSLAQQSAQAAPPKPEAPKFSTTLSIVGVAHTHNDVAAFVSSLQDSALLERIDLKYSEITLIEKEEYNKFLIHTKLRDDADARSVDFSHNLRAGAFLGNDAAASNDNEGDAEEGEGNLLKTMMKITTGGNKDQEEN
ncbi:MAG: PilN domain-containing protein [Planctomycetota bacterium]|jgi:Tfp pilus assembly protein PilN